MHWGAWSPGTGTSPFPGVLVTLNARPFRICRETVPVCYHSKRHVESTPSTLDEIGFITVQQIPMFIFNVCRLEVYMTASSVEKEMTQDKYD